MKIHIIEEFKIIERVKRFVGCHRIPDAHRLVPDDTVHKGTNKCHKMDEKVPILRCKFLHQYLYFLIYPTTPSTLSKFSRMI